MCTNVGPSWIAIVSIQSHQPKYQTKTIVLCALNDDWYEWIVIVLLSIGFFHWIALCQLYEWFSPVTFPLSILHSPLQLARFYLRTACVFICDVQGFYCIGFSTVDECYFDFGFCVSPWIRIYFVYTVGSNTRWNELFNQRLHNWDRCNPKIYYFRMGSNWAILNGLGQIELIRILPNLQLWKWIDPCMCWK